MFDLPDCWVWDFWTAEDPGAADSHHLFFLKASRLLGDPDLRHVHASVGHAISADLTHWTRVADAIDPQPAPAFDDRATWTGCVVRDDEDWLMFSTGISTADTGLVQRIGLSTSRDLLTWTRSPEPLLVADERWYARQPAAGLDEHWRDPWVVRDSAGLWHMYVTAQVPDRVGPGVVGHATSHDLYSWEVQPPLSAATGRFDQLEVISLHQVEGRWVLLFSCMHPEMPGSEPGAGGVWSVPVDGPGAPVDIDRAVRVTTERLYVGKLVSTRDGKVRLLAFENRRDGPAFVGGIIDPCRVTWNETGTGLRLVDAPAAWVPPP